MKTQSSFEVLRNTPLCRHALRLCVAIGTSWGLMLQRLNQHFPFTFNRAVDDPAIYTTLDELTSP